MPATLTEPAAERPTLRLRRDVIKPLPSQQKLLEAIRRYEYVLFGGAAGPGKSYILRWALIEILLVWYYQRGLTHVRVGLFCEDYPSLKDRQLSKIHREFPAWLGKITDSQTDGLCFTLADAHGAGQIALRNLDDPSKYASAEFAAIAVDELTKNSRQTFDDLRFRKRWPGIEHSPFLAASNPGSLGHEWVKKLWITRDFSGDDARLPSEQFYFIPARCRENPHLPASYWETLRSLPPRMRQAMEEGNWDVFAGQFFSEWNRTLHVLPPFPLPWHFRKTISLDYGYTNPSAVLWWAHHDGETYLYRELYVTQQTYQDLAEAIMERTPLTEQIEYVVADPSIWGDRPHQGEIPGVSGGETMSRLLQQQRRWPLIRGNHDRVQGWQRCRQLLQPIPLPDGQRGSRFHVFDTCEHFLRTIPALVHDPVHVEDLDSGGEDHCADAWRYQVNHTMTTDRVRRKVMYRPQPSRTALVG